MPVTMKSASVAYTKGVNAQRRGRKRTRELSPYGDNRRTQNAWFWAGYYDSELGKIDESMYTDDSSS